MARTETAKARRRAELSPDALRKLRKMQAKQAATNAAKEQAKRAAEFVPLWSGKP